jgi:hypothetical protein
MADDKMSLKDFRDLGFLQEANRQFFHPLGLALGLVANENEDYSSVIIYDWRDDPDGGMFQSLNEPRDKECYEYIKFIHDEKAAVRLEKFGFVIQPIGHVLEESNG